MGFHNYTHVGVFLTVKNQEVTTTETYYVSSAGNRKKTKLNPETGEEHGRVLRENKMIKRFHFNDLQYDDDNELEMHDR